MMDVDSGLFAPGVTRKAATSGVGETDGAAEVSGQPARHKQRTGSLHKAKEAEDKADAKANTGLQTVVALLATLTLSMARELAILLTVLLFDRKLTSLAEKEV